ncbi:MAG: GntR family transcriptional regulator [Clostridia bacterium]|nr:GntR family transcriptional regulator [Clostridia bacterium]
MPLYDKVLKSMQDKIRSGEWAAGEMIPREIDLCAMYDVSRSTIRMAMSRLVDAGALTRVKGMGTYVTGKQKLESSSLFITSFAQELEVRGLTPCTELLTFCTVPAVPEINAALQLSPTERLLKITRLRYVKDNFEHGPMVLTTSHFAARFFDLMQDADLEKSPLYSILLERGYTRRTFEKNLTARVLTDRESHMMGVATGALAILITSVSWDQNKKPLEYSSSLYPIDKNEFALRITV